MQENKSEDFISEHSVEINRGFLKIWAIKTTLFLRPINCVHGVNPLEISPRDYPHSKIWSWVYGLVQFTKISCLMGK